MQNDRRPTADDVRGMLRLCRTLHTSADSITRKRHLLAGLSNLLDAASAISVVAHVERIPRRHTILSTARHGVPAIRDEQLLANCLPAADAVNLPSSHELPWHHVMRPRRAAAGRRLCHCLRYSAPIDDSHVLACLSFSRTPETSAFGTHDEMILQLAHLEMSWVYDCDLLLARHGAADLSPRQRQTLDHLLAGHSEKQIAARMRLSHNTVHHHIKALYRHFGVSSRSELLAKWVK